MFSSITKSWGLCVIQILSPQSCHKLMYLLSERNWTDAQAACQADGGNLVSVTSIFESAFVGILVHQNYSYWIGLSDTKVLKL